MFKLDLESRLAAWSAFRKDLEVSESPLTDLSEFWKHTPYSGYNRLIDPYYQDSWPTPWEIIVENKYDDFTKSVMIGYTLLLTNRFKDSNIKIKTLVDSSNNRLYNVVCIDDTLALNYDDSQPVSIDIIPEHYRIENLIELKRPR